MSDVPKKPFKPCLEDGNGKADDRNLAFHLEHRTQEMEDSISGVVTKNVPGE
jgi:hypothetical protein